MDRPDDFLQLPYFLMFLCSLTLLHSEPCEAGGCIDWALLQAKIRIFYEVSQIMS